MLNHRFRLIGACLVVATLLLASCGNRVKEQAGGQDQEYRSSADPEIVSGHTSGEISVENRIIVQFVSEMVARGKVGTQVASGVLSVQPGIRGKVMWVDTRTIEVVPAEPLPRGRRYTVTVDPAAIDRGAFAGVASFSFSFGVMEQRLGLEGTGFRSAETDNLQELVFSGTLRTADVADPAEVERTLGFSLDGKKLQAEWSHAKVVHDFTVHGIVRRETAQELKLTMDGAPIGVTEKESFAHDVPLRVPFQITSAQTVEQAERYVEVGFSDPLLKTQDFRGLVVASPPRELRFAVSGSILRIYSAAGWGDSAELFLYTGIKNAANELLSAEGSYTLQFKPLTPQVSFVGNGVIVPFKEGVTVPIETMNLNAIIVEIEKIYADRIEQFLQVNELSGTSQIHRVGKTIWKKIVPVPYTPERRNQWIRTALDLSPLVSADRHSLYRITLSFDRRHIEYPGAETTEAGLQDFPLEDLAISGSPENIRVLSAAFWAEHATHVSSQDWDNYYENRNNPLHPSFYREYYYEESRRRAVSRSFLVSDLGVIAQRDSGNRLTVAVSDLQSAEPVRDAVVSVLDYQLQKLAQLTTDSSGLVSTTLQAEGFLVVAESKSSRAYVKLEGANTLPVSQFDVAGQEVQQGVKGFIYGERGVWRPGDTIYLTFILQDREDVLPPDHPVTVRLYDPSGKLVKTASSTDPVGCFYHFALTTSPEDRTGTYTAKVLVGGVTFAKELPVETVKPNRLKIQIGFAAKLTELQAAGAKAEMEVSWLHGAIAGGMRTDVRISLASIPTAFADYAGYTFDDPVRAFKAESKEVFAGTLDAQGKASFDLALAPTARAPGKLVATFGTRVYEPSGSVNTDSFSIPFHPFARYAGIRIPDEAKGNGWLDVDEAHAAQIVLVGTDGKPVSTGEVDVEVYHIGWRWWWDRQDDDIADFLGSQEYELVSSERLQVKGGSAQWTLKFKERVWGRYLVRVRDRAGGHATGKILYMRWPGWYYSSPTGGADAASMLVFSADKSSYQVGETARITIPTADRGRILVSIENNGRLLSTQWVTADKEQTIHEIKITDRMAPNIYVHVSHVQPHGQTVNDHPIRMFGIIPLSVEDPSTRLKPVLEMPDVLEPSSTAEVSVSESSGQPMTYTLAVVDEGLLSLTRFATPDAWMHFYRRDASAVGTFDMYGLVASAYGGALEKLLAVGGAEEGTAGQSRKANRFPPMVRFLGPFELARGAKTTHQVSLPQYVGAVRVMVVAGTDKAYGYVAREVPVKKPVMVYATLPRVASITEQIALPVSVFAMEEEIRSVDVKVTASGKLRLAGTDRASVIFDATGDKLVTFDLVADSQPGLAQVQVTATGGGVTALQTVEIDVRNPNTPVTTVDELLLGAGESKSQEFALTGIPGTNTVALEVSRITPINLDQRLRFLIHYPYGCVEQTTSSVFPQLYLDKITDLGAAETAEVRKNVQAGIYRLRQFQTSSGGFGYWPGDSSVSAYSTTYAAHFLLEAERLGYVVGVSMKRNALSYLRSQVSRWSWGIERSDLVQAYALFDLALAGEPELGAMNRMRERLNLPAEVRAKLAAAYGLAGQRQEAERLVRGQIAPFSPYAELGGSYGSGLRDTAMLAEGFLECGDTQRAASLVADISKSLAAGDWYSTQTTAYCLLVIGKYLGGLKVDQRLQLTYEWNGRAQTLDTDAPVARVPLAVEDETLAQKLRTTSRSQVPLYVRIVKTGTPALGKEEAVSRGLSLQVSYRDRTGYYTADIDSVQQGKDVLVIVSVQNPSGRSYEELVLNYLFPAGYEASAPRIGTFVGDQGFVEGGAGAFDYQDIRDDRVLTFFDLASGESKTFTLTLNASYLGKFYLPQCRVEAMYDASICAAVAGRWVTVVSDTGEASQN